MTFDIQLFYLLNNLAGQSAFLDGIFVFLASYLAYLLIAFFLLLVFFLPAPRREKLQMLLVVGASSIIARFGVVEIIRFFYHRPRPFSVFPVHQLLTDPAWSFPSGHATFFFAMATAVYLYNRTCGIVFFIATMFITVSRVVAGIHYPSDIIGGAIVGVGVAYATFYVVRALVRPADEKESSC